MSNDHWTYSAVLTAMSTAVVGMFVGALVSYRVFSGQRRRHAVYLLLVSLLGLSMAQFIEQTRVLVFRLSYDGFISRSVFNAVYSSTFNVSVTKVGLAVSLGLAAAVNLGLYCNHDDKTIIRWAAYSIVGTLSLWASMALILDRWI